MGARQYCAALAKLVPCKTMSAPRTSTCINWDRAIFTKGAAVWEMAVRRTDASASAALNAVAKATAVVRVASASMLIAIASSPMLIVKSRAPAKSLKPLSRVME